MSDDKYTEGKGFYEFISDASTFAGIIYLIILICGSGFGCYQLTKLFSQNDALHFLGGLIGAVAGFSLAVVTLTPAAILKQLQDKNNKTVTKIVAPGLQTAAPETKQTHYETKPADINDDLNQYN